MSTASDILPPVHGGQLRKIATLYKISADQLLDFSANINPAGPPSSVVGAIRRALDDPSTLTAYPDLELLELKQTIAKCTGVHSENIAVANGFVPLLAAALRTLNIKKCLLPVPSFGEYRRTLENVGVIVIPYLLSQGEEFRYESDTLLSVLVEQSCDAILLANPQNPSGTLYAAWKMRRLIEMAAQNSITVLLDEAFIDYCPFDSSMRLTVEQENVIVFRSVTKFFAIPGLRVAYAVSNSGYTSAMNRFIAPWPITSFASNAVSAALLDEAYAEESRLANERRRSSLELKVAQLNVATYPSITNFLLLRFSTEVDVSLLWERMIVEQQIVLRSCANFEGLPTGHLRIAVRSETENERLIRGLKRVLSTLAGDGRKRRV